MRNWFKADENYDKFLTTERNTPSKSDLEQMYQATFGSKEGFATLLHLLSQLAFFRETETPEEQLLNNFAKKLLRNLGCWDQGKGAAILTNILRVWKET